MSTPGSVPRLATPVSGGLTSSHMSHSSRRSTPSSTASTRSLLHSGHSISNVVHIDIPEKNSPIQATPLGFKRVKITPQRMDDAFLSAVGFENKLRIITDHQHGKQASPEEQKEMMSAMGNLFDDDDDQREGSVTNGSNSKISARETISGSSSSQNLTVSTKKSVSAALEFQVMPPLPEGYDLMFEESSFLERKDLPVRQPNFTDDTGSSFSKENAESIPDDHDPAGEDFKWLNLLSTAAGMLELDDVAPPILPTQYQARHQSTLSAGLSTTKADVSLSKLVDHATKTAESSSPVFVARPSIASALPDVAVPKLSTSLKPPAELDPSLQPYIQFLQAIDQEFFPTAMRNEDALRLWQRHMLLPPDSLQESVFQQHGELVKMGIFEADDESLSATSQSVVASIDIESRRTVSV